MPKKQSYMVVCGSLVLFLKVYFMRIPKKKKATDNVVCDKITDNPTTN